MNGGPLCCSARYESIPLRQAAGLSFYHPSPLREVWRQAGDRLDGQQEIFVQDPDGYLLMLNQDLGERHLDPVGTE
ncbi:MAG: hypothetical protein QF384_15800 [Alphaproteobacteria bacterium]|jgi:hypothetical protein|nr:hypothetical protein [Alphaproteobacteria bacterium]MDP6874320.1 hypothetical protein [Alphaproteobacteria bacterium]